MYVNLALYIYHTQLNFLHTHVQSVLRSIE